MAASVCCRSNEPQTNDIDRVRIVGRKLRSPGPVSYGCKGSDGDVAAALVAGQTYRRGAFLMRATAGGFLCTLTRDAAESGCILPNDQGKQSGDDDCPKHVMPHLTSGKSSASRCSHGGSKSSGFLLDLAGNRALSAGFREMSAENSAPHPSNESTFVVRDAAASNHERVAAGGYSAQMTCVKTRWLLPRSSTNNCVRPPLVLRISWPN